VKESDSICETYAEMKKGPVFLPTMYIAEYNIEVGTVLVILEADCS